MPAKKKETVPTKRLNPKRGTGTTMTAQMLKFVDEFMLCFNGYQAAVKAGYKEKNARHMASDLLAREDIQAEIGKRQKRIEQRTEISAARVITEIWGIATADVNELVEFRRTCCRHCYGIDYGFQRTVAEMNRDRRTYLEQREKDERKDNFDPLSYKEYDEQGGIGYDARKPPNNDCQECFGEGVGTAHFKDTRTLSSEARALYAGVKQTKDGYQMLTIDKMAALEKLMKHLGQYKVDNEQKSDALKDLLALIHARNTRLPIKDQGA